MYRFSDVANVPLRRALSRAGGKSVGAQGGQQAAAATRRKAACTHPRRDDTTRLGPRRARRARPPGISAGGGALARSGRSRSHEARPMRGATLEIAYARRPTRSARKPTADDAPLLAARPALAGACARAGFWLWLLARGRGRAGRGGRRRKARACRSKRRRAALALVRRSFTYAPPPFPLANRLFPSPARAPPRPRRRRRSFPPVLSVEERTGLLRQGHWASTPGRMPARLQGPSEGWTWEGRRQPARQPRLTTGCSLPYLAGSPCPESRSQPLPIERTHKSQARRGQLSARTCNEECENPLFSISLWDV